MRKLRVVVPRANRRLRRERKVTLAFDFPTPDHVRLGHTSFSVLGFGSSSVALQLMLIFI